MLLLTAAFLAVTDGAGSAGVAPKNTAPVTEVNAGTLSGLFSFGADIEERKWTSIVLHHTATKGGTARQFDEYHRKAFGDPGGIEYHFVINNGVGKGSRDGLVEVTSRWTAQKLGAHLFRPELAEESIAVCFVGNFEESDSLTKVQYREGVALVKKLKERYGIAETGILMHKQIDSYERFKKDGRPSTACPGKFFPYKKMLGELNGARP
ncbi:MAG: N-acetylmuramoyl-L-alanine amidase [Deltaproteobacteria bacterium]|nr:N-acetylmuramoyl-L-alanine amidase [Deltaproteobacteria bacterium]